MIYRQKRRCFGFDQIGVRWWLRFFGSLMRGFFYSSLIGFFLFDEAIVRCSGRSLPTA